MVASKKNPVNQKPPSQDEQPKRPKMYLQIPGAYKPIQKQMWVAMALTAISVICGLFFLFLYLSPDSEITPAHEQNAFNAAYLFLVILSGAALLFGIRSIDIAHRELELSRFTRGQELFLTHVGVEISIVLIEGEMRHYLRSRRQAFFKATWADILSWQTVQEGENKLYPASHYLVTLVSPLDNGMPTQLILQRELFLSEEKPIADFVQQYLKSPSAVTAKRN